jgi:tetratricopeptide (TPR) repeat protein
MAQLKNKVLIEALKLVSSDPIKLKNYFDDHRLSFNEKKILEAYLHFRNANYPEVLALIESIEVPDQEIMAQKNLLMGLTLTNMSQFESALIFYQKAEHFFKTHDLNYYYMLTLINEFNVYLNCFDLPGLFRVGEELLKLNLKECERPERILRCLYHFHRLNQNKDLAYKIKQTLYSLYPEMPEADQIMYQLDRFHEAIRAFDFEEARAVISTIKLFKKYYSAENFKFMQRVLDFVEFDKPLYFQREDFEAVPFLFHQISCLRFLEEGKRVEALGEWEQLSILFPRLYQEQFSYAGETTLFSLALHKLKERTAQKEIKVDVKGLNKKQVILKILENSVSPINQEELFKLVWGRPVEDKNDLLLLSKTIYKLKQEFQVEVLTKKKCYSLLKKPSKAS